MEFVGPLLKERYRLGPRLGAGGQGHTYLARDELSDGAVVVVKQLQLKEHKSWKRFDLYEREVRVLQALQHRGIPRFIDSFEGEPAGTFYLVMSHARGENLRDLAEQKALDRSDLRDVLRRTLEILVYIHGREPPVIHRDIKPANLVRNKNGEIALVDFGGVRDALRPEGGSTVVGTFGYMAPEQLHGQATPATDIYGLGATIVALASGVEPENVPRKGLAMDLKRHLKGMAKPLVQLLARMTDPDPDTRIGSADEALTMLGEPASRPAQPEPTAPPPDRGAPGNPEPADAARETGTADPDEDDGEILELDESIPPPLRMAIGVALYVASIAGYATLTAVQWIVMPIAFTLISAFVGPQSRKRLRESRATTNRALTDGRKGFRRLQSRALPRPKRLPPHHPEPRHKRRRDRKRGKR